MVEPPNPFLEFLFRHWGRVVGTLAGLVGAWLFVTYGFWKSLLILLLGALGYLAGAAVDRRATLRGTLRRFWRGDR